MSGLSIERMASRLILALGTNADRMEDVFSLKELAHRGESAENRLVELRMELDAARRKMRPYNFRFQGRYENEYLIDLDKVAVIGKPYFDMNDGIAYISIAFDKGTPLQARFLTEYACIDPSVSTDDKRPMEERMAVMQRTWQDFLDTVDALKKAWTDS